MSGTMSKRQQARNEKALHEIAQHSGNNVCADCSARNPSMFDCWQLRPNNLPPSHGLFTLSDRLTHLLPQLGHHGAYVYKIPPLCGRDPYNNSRPIPDPVSGHMIIPPRARRTLLIMLGSAVGNLSVHAVRHHPPQVGHPHLQGQVFEHG